MSNKQTTVAPAEQASKQVPTEELDCDSNHAERGFPCLCAEECQPAAPVAATEQAKEVRDALQYIHDTFKRDLDAGYITPDKQFAVEIAGDALATPADAGAAILAGKVPEGRSVIEILRRAMDQAGVQGVVRGMLVGYFGNEWNKSTGTASAGDFAEYWNSLEHDCEGAELARYQRIAQRAWSAAQAAIPAEPNCEDIGAVVNRFLAWPLPASVSARLAPNVTFPIGTHIMSADEAKAMFAHCLARLSTSAAPVTASLQVRKATDELSLPELAEQFAAVEQLGCDYVLSAKVCGKLFRAMTTQPEFIQSPAPVTASDELLAECRAVFDLMLDGCALQEFGEYQNGHGETIGPRMDALHAKLRAVAAKSGAPVTAEPASWILQARSPEGDPWQNITPEQYSAANAAGYETRMVPAAPQPAAQVPSIDPDSAMQTAEQASQEWADNQKRCGFYFTDARRQIYRDGFLAAALKGQPAAAHAAKTDEQREREQIEARAKEIYSTFPYAHLFPWRERFNSIKQDEARAKARAELKSAAHAAHDQKEGKA